MKEDDISWEIPQAVKEFIKKSEKKDLSPSDITREWIKQLTGVEITWPKNK